LRNAKRYVRGLTYLCQYLFFEKPKGLDFSLRDLSEIKNQQQHGYAMTSDKAIENISSIVSFKDKRFLDIGSGKGRVPYKASQLGCRVADGVEFSEKFHRIAVNNYQILEVSDRCKSHNLAAENFKNYNDYDIYFLFNPFEDELYGKVIDEIMKQVEINGMRHLICYGGANLGSVYKYENIQQIYKGLCPHRNNHIAVFKF